MIRLPESEYLLLRGAPSPSGKTYVVDVLSRTRGFALGVLRWHGPWRQYVFHPAPDTLFNAGCLRDLTAALEALNAERRERPRREAEAARLLEAYE